MRSAGVTVVKKLKFGDEIGESRDLHHVEPLTSPILLKSNIDNGHRKPRGWTDILCQYHVGEENIFIVVLMYTVCCILILTLFKHPHCISDFTKSVNAKFNFADNDSEDHIKAYHIAGVISSVLVALLAGITCCGFSWTITYFDSLRPGQRPPTPVSPHKYRYRSGHNFHMNYAVAIANGSVVFCLILWWLPG